MKQSIQLRLGQHLTMTPQLQQAIRLLQLSTIELQLEVQGVLESNLMLEQDEGDTQTDTDAAKEASRESEAKTVTDGDAEQSAGADSDIANNADTLPDELPGDTSWEDTFDTGATSYSAPGESDGRDFFETHNSEGETLHEHLMWQLDLTPFSDIDREIATTILDAINDDG